MPIAESLRDISLDRRIEFPVAEDLQLGMCIGLSLEGFLPVCIYPRMDFLVLALNQLVNHLDKIEKMSYGRFRPKVIVRVSVGSKEPLDAGEQHTQDHTMALHIMLRNLVVEDLTNEEKVMLAYKEALSSARSTILIEYGELMK